MGGNALQTPRVPRETYFRLKRQIFDTIQQDGRLERLDVLLWEDTERVTFGDIDVYLCPIHVIQNMEQIIQIIQDLFKPDTFHRNGSVFSFVLENVQVDMIMVQNDFARVYYGLALGMCAGDSMKRIGLTLRDTGLYVDIKNGKGDKKMYLLLSEDPDLFLRFLGTKEKPFLMKMDRSFMVEQIINSWWFSISDSGTKKKHRDEHHFYSLLLHSTEKDRKRCSKPVEYDVSYALDFFGKLVVYQDILQNILDEEKKSDHRNRIRNMVLSMMMDLGYVKVRLQQKYADFQSRYPNYEEWIEKNSLEIIKQECQEFLSGW